MSLAVNTSRKSRSGARSPRANVNPLKMEKFEKAFSSVASHFRLSEQEKSLAKEAAMEDYAHANECYMAIARSL